MIASSPKRWLRELTESRLAAAAGELWEAGTRAAFLDAIGDGTLPREAFERWLVQDYLFVKGFAGFVALVAARTPRPEQSLAIGGLSALDEELSWFEGHAAERHLRLDAEPHPTCRRYVDYLLDAGGKLPFEVLLAVFYGVEVAYAVAWGRLRRTGPYAEFIERWTNPDFVAYVAELGRAADRHPHPDQQREFDAVMLLERDFWRMSWEG